MTRARSSLRFPGACLLLPLAAIGFGCADSGGDASPTSDGSATTQTASGVAAATDADVYVALEEAAAILDNQGAQTIFLPGCAPFEFERRLEGDWVGAGPPFVCVWEGFAVPVETGEFQETDFRAPAESGLYRLRYDFGMGCDDGQPLGQANCTTLSSLLSNEFEVVRETCDPADAGCLVVPAAPNELCDDGAHVAGPSETCTRDPASGVCGYELLRCP